MTYYIYRNPVFNKIGCTADPLKRIEIQQGMKPWPDFVIDQSDDIMVASHLEAYYKGIHNAKWDHDIYMAEIKTNTMKTIINKTNNARFFGNDWLEKNLFLAKCPNGVEFRIEDKLYASFDYRETTRLIEEGVIQNSKFNKGFYAVPDAVLNAKERYKDNEPSLLEFGVDKIQAEKLVSRSIEEFEQVREWARNKGLYEKGDPKTQLVKLIEELGETSKAILKPKGWIAANGNTKEEEIQDGLGDTLVVLINLTHLLGYSLEDCLKLAYSEIKSRTGQMIGGTFHKNDEQI